MNRCFIWNKIVFKLNSYELGHRSYGLFSNDMQKHEIDAGAMHSTTY